MHVWRDYWSSLDVCGYMQACAYKKIVYKAWCLLRWMGVNMVLGGTLSSAKGVKLASLWERESDSQLQHSPHLTEPSIWKALIPWKCFQKSSLLVAEAPNWYGSTLDQYSNFSLIIHCHANRYSWTHCWLCAFQGHWRRTLKGSHIFNEHQNQTL